jgi:anaerobic selenocysteine-containing dehydrogenase
MDLFVAMREQVIRLPNPPPYSPTRKEHVMAWVKLCPCCAVGCAQNLYVKDNKVVQIEGDPDAPHSRGRLCPKGAATLQLTTDEAREGMASARAVEPQRERMRHEAAVAGG